MTGIRAGSQGTGVLEGSRPGTGVTGGSGPPSVISGNENILIELDTGSGFAPVADYTAPFDLSMSPLFDSLTTPVPNPINTIFASENFTSTDADLATITDDLTTPVPIAVMDIAATETVDATDVETAVVTDDIAIVI